jgi:hypothetical protein
MAQIYAAYDSQTGAVLTFLSDEIHEARHFAMYAHVPITDDEWQSCYPDVTAWKVDVAGKRLVRRAACDLHDASATVN